MITICPDNQFKIDKIRSLGYVSEVLFFQGKQSNVSYYAWGSNYNMTFDELYKSMLKFDAGRTIVVDLYVERRPRRLRPKAKFFPILGYCLRIFDYPTAITTHITVRVPKTVKKLHVFLVDKHLDTSLGFDISTHKGTEISMSQAGTFSYEVTVELASRFDPRQPDNCVAYNLGDFEACKNREYQEVGKAIFGCNPPWLSDIDQCNDTYTLSDVARAEWNEIVRRMYLYKIGSLSPGNYTSSCRQPCRIIKSHVLVKSKVENEKAVTSKPVR